MAFRNVPISADQISSGQYVVSAPGDGVFVYSGPPAAGNLIASLASADGVDPYGNAYTYGLELGGQLDGDSIANAITLQPKNVGGSTFQPAEIFTKTLTTGENQTWISSPYDTKKGQNSAGILLRGSDATNAGGCSIYLDAFTTAVGGVFSAGNIQVGSVNIVPSAANTPTSAAVSFGPLQGSKFYGFVAAATTVPGSTTSTNGVTGVGITGVTASGATVWVTRQNTTQTTVNYMVFGV